VAKKKLGHSAKNLVVLQYCQNTCYTSVVKFDINKLPEGVLSVNPNGGTWQTKTAGFHPCTQSLRIGKDVRRCDGSCRYGVIGIYDSTDVDHLDKMVNDAKEATRETLVCYD